MKSFNRAVSVVVAVAEYQAELEEDRVAAVAREARLAAQEEAAVWAELEAQDVEMGWG